MTGSVIDSLTMRNAAMMVAIAAYNPPTALKPATETIACVTKLVRSIASAFPSSLHMTECATGTTTIWTANMMEVIAALNRLIAQIA